MIYKTAEWKQMLSQMKLKLRDQNKGCVAEHTMIPTAITHLLEWWRECASSWDLGQISWEADAASMVMIWTGFHWEGTVLNPKNMLCSEVYFPWNYSQFSYHWICISLIYFFFQSLSFLWYLCLMRVSYKHCWTVISANFALPTFHNSVMYMSHTIYIVIYIVLIDIIHCMYSYVSGAALIYIYIYSRKFQPN